VQEIPLKHSKTKTNKEEPPKQIRQIKIERRNIYLGLWLKNVILIVYVLVTRKNREKTSFFSFVLSFAEEKEEEEEEVGCERGKKVSRGLIRHHTRTKKRL
jgi:hypothetical protein